MKNEKYYIPSIEEFHVGFEYEAMMIHEDRFLKHIVEELNHITGFSPPTELRVKHLDREDIESFGFKPMAPATSSGWYVFNMVKNEKNIHLSHAPVDNSIAIQVRIDGMLDKDIDHLTIKNKSELKTLMKWLNIV
jgi:hypothetical protein